MNEIQKIDGVLFYKMLNSGFDNLQRHCEEINNLNVFPIPDGDTGDNMLLTLVGGIQSGNDNCEDISVISRSVADGMLLSARGNSGVILSQLFEGIASGLSNVKEADWKTMSDAMSMGVDKAYKAVLKPQEGTILTVAKVANENTKTHNFSSVEEYLTDYIKEARTVLNKTPEMLDVLKKAGVVDSGGAGLICIIEGMFEGMHKNIETIAMPTAGASQQELDISKFTSDSVLEFGYCTELLVRLQNSKTDVASFDINTVTDYLTSIGDSVAAFKNDSVLKLHVHTMTPHLVLEFCQKFGEFLKIKIENMSLQHNNIEGEDEKSENDGKAATSDFTYTSQTRERQRFATIAVCSGDGIVNLFKDAGVTEIIEGGQSMNPSAKDFINAFDKVYADEIFVFPNNGNIILAAKQAAEMYSGSNIHVIESKNIGQGFASLSMFDSEGKTVEEIENALIEAMNYAKTVSVSQSVRNTEGVTKGEYIAFCEKDILCSVETKTEAAIKGAALSGISDFDICIIIAGEETSDEDAAFVEQSLGKEYPSKEIFTVRGNQKIYDFILILE